MKVKLEEKKNSDWVDRESISDNVTPLTEQKLLSNETDQKRGCSETI